MLLLIQLLIFLNQNWITFYIEFMILCFFIYDFLFPCWFWLKAIRLLRLWINFTVRLPRTLMFSTIRELDLTRKIPFPSHSDSFSNFNTNTKSSTIESHFVFTTFDIFICFGILLFMFFFIGMLLKRWHPQRNWLFRWPCPLILQEISLSTVC